MSPQRGRVDIEFGVRPPCHHISFVPVFSHRRRINPASMISDIRYDRIEVKATRNHLYIASHRGSSTGPQIGHVSNIQDAALAQPVQQRATGEVKLTKALNTIGFDWLCLARCYRFPDHISRPHFVLIRAMRATVLSYALPRNFRHQPGHFRRIRYEPRSPTFWRKTASRTT
ncbi:hypothetical protein BC827DRAFT_774852 [Russula dissimulans]|nr:hypothetical protein BC827DRAFT_774852 [Russula dissimulans]